MADDYGQDPTTAGQLTVGVSTAGTINYGAEPFAFTTDHDWFAVQLTGGHSYRIDVSGTGASDARLSSPILDFRNANGDRLTGDIAHNRDAHLYLHVNHSDTYYADVGGEVIPDADAPSGFIDYQSTGTYQIKVQDLGTGTNTRFISDASTVSLGIAAFGASSAAGGWTSENLFPRMLAQVDGDGSIVTFFPTNKRIGDGFADIVAFGNQGMYVARGTGDGNFADPQGRRMRNPRLAGTQVPVAKSPH